MRRALVSLFLVGACLLQAQETPRWRLQYFHDVDKVTFQIADLKFPSPQRGIAVGAIVGDNNIKPMSAITSDGGAHWTLVPLKEPGQSLFFLNDSLGWMVTPKGIWQTEESGRTWRKLKSPDGILRVHFLDPDHGFAVGLRKQVFETTDGGRKWVKLTFPGELKADPDYARFTWIEFASKDVGMIGGVSIPPRRLRQRFPDWLDPETASERRALPRLSLLAETRDGGKNWSPGSTSLFGEITATRLSPEGWGAGLIEFSDRFDWPSELIFINWKAGTQRGNYRQKDRKITDVAIAAPRGPLYIAGIEHFGSLQTLPIPRKVKILRSDNASDWTEMRVDYRAVARRVILASAGDDNVWAATDTGMILKLTK